MHQSKVTTTIATFKQPHTVFSFEKKNNCFKGPGNGMILTLLNGNEMEAQLMPVAWMVCVCALTVSDGPL